MNTQERKPLLERIVWDYNIPPEEAEAIINGEKEMAGHYTK